MLKNKTILVLCAWVLTSPTVTAKDLSINLNTGEQNISVTNEGVEIRQRGDQRVTTKADRVAVKQSTTIQKFNKLRLDTDANLQVHIGKKVSVDLGKNHASLSAHTKQGVLTISAGESAPEPDSEVNVWADDISSVELDSSGDIHLENIRQEKLELLITGSGSITVSGRVRYLSAVIQGSGSLELAELVTDNADVKVSGSGDARVNVRGKLRAEITGSGDISYQGSPRQIIPKISGSGSINPE